MITFYKGNERNTGAACQFWYSTSQDGFFLEMLKQSGWDPKLGPKGVGLFKDSKKNPQKSATIKLSKLEACGILNAIETKGKFSAYHSFKGTSTQLALEPWEKDPKQESYTLKVLRTSAEDKTATGKTSIMIGLKPDELRLVREYLVLGLQELLKNKVEEKEESPKTKKEEPVVAATVPVATEEETPFF